MAASRALRRTRAWVDGSRSLVRVIYESRRITSFRIYPHRPFSSRRGAAACCSIAYCLTIALLHRGDICASDRFWIHRLLRRKTRLQAFYTEMSCPRVVWCDYISRSSRLTDARDSILQPVLRISPSIGSQCQCILRLRTWVQLRRRRRLGLRPQGQCSIHTSRITSINESQQLQKYHALIGS